ncbi:NUDIX hydrolase [Microlunatus panaciterrae]|uniref:8-oxo-dGTP pyrophosphatase MutT (NUDIX family) n=1 Tax=Microlunatus panaciterrae TaxID=400768 RepID=A0ABS2RER5_9ACTN|nr:NUDIX hydrolase [Microlunatus panaciterrae]MBM7797485.1 8-oxo-dGTP pyrophosphatase MutT (NUDIX family) [Microlunatus panaciterrae]
MSAVADGSSLQVSCLNVLTRWQPPGPEQAELRRDYLAHLEARPAGWSRECAGAHLTASSLICSLDVSQVLLTLHARLGRWLQTGGHLESTDRSLEDAALREAREESGLHNLQLDPRPLLLSRHEVPCGLVRPTFHLDVQFLVVADPALTPSVSAESTDVRWFSREELPPIDDSVAQLIQAASTRLAA